MIRVGKNCSAPSPSSGWRRADARTEDRGRAVVACWQPGVCPENSVLRRIHGQRKQSEKADSYEL